MFDKVLLTQTNREYIPYEKIITEKRAPTDESIKLYNEMKEKAYSSILKSIQINDNSLNVSAVLFNDLASFERICKYRLTLNGQEVEGNIKVDVFREKDKIDLLQEIVKRVAQDISAQIGLLLAREMQGENYAKKVITSK